jgi:hypothetical protein
MRIAFACLLSVTPVHCGLLDLFELLTWSTKDAYFTQKWTEDVMYSTLSTITFVAVCDWSPGGTMDIAFTDSSVTPADSVCGKPCALLKDAFASASNTPSLPFVDKYYSESDHVQIIALVSPNKDEVPLTTHGFPDPDITANTFMSFRGTYVWDVVNSRRNKNYLLRPAPGFCSGCAAHQGWFSNFMALRYMVGQAAVDSKMFLSPNSPKWGIVGHSMGAALAQYASMYVVNRAAASMTGPYSESAVSALYTFGCPRVGNKLLADKVKTSAANSAAFNMFSDVVGHIPFRVLGYRHSFKKIYELFIDPVYFAGYSTGDIDKDYSKYMSFKLHNSDADFAGSPFSLSFADHNSYFVGLSEEDLAACGGMADHFLFNSKAMELFS